ncbi:hypothetical protein Micbo1qcDRAFT_161097 [Microdochium bolleyi]|uniref:Uncharacterized protein n=1 Tax=Microdochium bolleyi TaxID=196109 RepID=A0A136J7L7_9PEZI|nr:hypothetical protein Micbo1qcDRAFT_161097 [Microdochium bolleyi]
MYAALAVLAGTTRPPPVVGTTFLTFRTSDTSDVTSGQQETRTIPRGLDGSRVLVDVVPVIRCVALRTTAR